MEISYKDRLGRYFFLYGLSFLLLLEWLMPLPQVTDTGFVNIFVLFTAMFFIVTFFQFPIWISVPLKALIILYGIHIIFFEAVFLSGDWWELFLLEMQRNLQYLLNGQWYGLTYLFRSLLFFILLAMMSYILFYWTVYAKRLMFFLFFTVLYVSIIDTFTVYDATFAIIRIFFIGFLLLGLLKMFRLVEEEKVAISSKFLPFRYASLVVIIMFFAVVIGLLGPKPSPQWDDPVPFIQTALGVNSGPGGIGGVSQEIGYSTNDERLGGGFTMNDETVLFATTDRGYYWRGESKDFYTGKGWDVTTPNQLEERSYFYEQFVEKERKEIEINVVSDRQYDQLFYHGELITAQSDRMDFSTVVDRQTGKAEAMQNGSLSLDRYSLVVDSPTFPIERLRTTRWDDPEEIVSYYTQLPDDLPGRVQELAQEIIRNDDNRYDMARSIERYFSMASFQYDINNVPFPGPDQDYVDQFLFETRRGYCDNFSSAMVVLLRSVDIPARWVKGFTQGERVETLEDGRHVYEVTNANAHSWVEVYFPNIGWVPFEPTRGFRASVDFSINTDIEVEENPLEEETGEPEVEEALAPMEEEKEEKNEAVIGIGSFPNFSFIPLIILAAIVLICFLKRKQLLAAIFLLSFRNRNGTRTFGQAYHRLIWFLRFYGYGKREEETLREYATRVDRLFSTADMMLLTESYEKTFYGRASSEQEWEKSRQLWENLIKKIGS